MGTATKGQAIALLAIKLHIHGIGSKRIIHTSQMALVRQPYPRPLTAHRETQNPPSLRGQQ